MRVTMDRLLLIIMLSSVCAASVSTNVPLDHWSYREIDKLAGMGLIEGHMPTTLPLSRLEMARHISEAMETAKLRRIDNDIVPAILDRLAREFKHELVMIGVLEGNAYDSFVKPIEDPYFRYLYARNMPNLENRRGDIFGRGSNFRFGVVSRAKFFDRGVVYLHPEFVDSSTFSDGDVDLVEGYAKVQVGNVEIEAGQDSMWWGPGRHGSMIMSNNAAPLRMVKMTNATPLPPPWILKGLGPFKGTWFLAELGSNRVVPKTKLTGMRLNFKPRPDFEFGLSRVIMFDGGGQGSVGLSDYAEMFLIRSEQAATNQLAGFDLSFFFPVFEWMPVRSLRVYVDTAGEDEAGGLPSKWGRLFGIQVYDLFKTGRTDVRVEYANNHVAGFPNVFYNHELYQSGYTYAGRVIGHNMGTDSEELFAQVTHYVSPEIILDVVFNRQEHSLSSAVRPTTERVSVDVTYLGSDQWQARAGYRYERYKNQMLNDNHILEFYLIRDF